MRRTCNIPTPSPWVVRFLPLISKNGDVLDLACGQGRHSVFLASEGLRITALDRDISRLPRDERINPVEANLEEGNPWPLAGQRFDGIVVTNYLHRPLFPILIDSLRPGGVMIYETFSIGNEAYGRPRDPEFLLREGELLEAFSGKLTVVAYEAGAIDQPAPAVVQRIAAVKQGKTANVILVPV
ncbi:MAG: methyltransferase domain-containing protein [Pseudomonadota bacterium]|nr:methyltransferase domain-containing protein [Pseudomonadota bacterium]